MPVKPRRLSLVPRATPAAPGVDASSGVGATPGAVVASTLAGLMHQRRITLSEAEVLRQVAVAMLAAEAADGNSAANGNGNGATVMSLDDYRNRRFERLANPA